MFENIRADVMRIHRCNKILRPFDMLHSLWSNYGLQALVIYRFGRWLNNEKKQYFIWAIATPVFWLLSVYIRKAYDINLDQSADVAPGFYINHFGGIEVRNCRIGPGCNIQQQVKLGVTKATVRGLVIGDGVYIGAHTQIHSNIRIGDGVTIGAGAVVTQDIPHHCLVIGNPGRIVQRDYDNSSLL
jgi:serine O-acetyltransferase